MKTTISRRGFLASAAATCAWAMGPARLPARAAELPRQAADLGFPLVDFHVHLDNSTIDQVATLSKERGIKFGIVEHAGTKENKYPVVLSNDAELKGYVAMLEGKSVFKGIQAEWIDWMGCFSPEALARLDFVLSDAMTMPGPDGGRMKLWEPGAEIGDPQRFMDRYVDWHIEILEKEPLDILGNVTWLPGALAADYDALWTPARMKKVVDAAVKHRVALEISSSYKLPKRPFLEVAKAAGAKFSFGSNGRYPRMGLLDYSVAMARELGLKPSDMFRPAPDGQKAVQRRKFV